MPRRNSHWSGVSSIHLPLFASTAFLGTETSTQWAASAAKTMWGRTVKAPANARVRLLNMRTSFSRSLFGCFPLLTEPIVPFADHALDEADNITRFDYSRTMPASAHRLKSMIWAAAGRAQAP